VFYFTFISFYYFFEIMCINRRVYFSIGVASVVDFSGASIIVLIEKVYSILFYVSCEFDTVGV